jgi:hypothetical protein
MAEKPITSNVTIAGQAFVLRNSDVLGAVATVEPEPITN